MNRTLIIAVALALLAPMAHATDYVARIVVMDHTSFKPEYEAQMAPARTIVTPPEGGWPAEVSPLAAAVAKPFRLGAGVKVTDVYRSLVKPNDPHMFPASVEVTLVGVANGQASLDVMLRGDAKHHKLTLPVNSTVVLGGDMKAPMTEFVGISLFDTDTAMKMPEIAIWGSIKDVKPPRILSRVPPKYNEQPPSGLIAVVQVELDDAGKLVGANLVRPLPEPFNQPILDAVRQWKFKPAEYAGEPIQTLFLLMVDPRMTD